MIHRIMDKQPYQSLKLSILLLMSGLSVFSQSVSPQIAVQALPYWHPEIGHYVDVLFSMQREASLESHSMDISLVIHRKDGMASMDRINISLPPGEPSTFVQGVRLPADTGLWIVSIAFEHSPGLWDSLQGQIHIADIQASISKILLTEEALVSATLLPWMARYGFATQPLPQIGEAWITGDSATLRFYTETYGLPQGKRGLLSYELQSTSNENLGIYNGQVMIPAGQVLQPNMQSMDISALPSGHYNLVMKLWVEGNDSAASDITSITFNRYNPQELESLSTASLMPHWVALLGTGDSLDFNISSLYPIATSNQRRQLDHLLESGNDTLKWRFGQRYWQENHLSNPEAACKSYQAIVAEVERTYGSRAIHGFLTDRGRIFLQYGTPTLTEKRPFENDGYPYEIWQYNQLEASNAPYQINKLFVFDNNSTVGRNYDLIHSNAIGEMQNPKWRIAIQKRSYITDDIDQTGSSDGEKFGSRINNNIFFNSGGG